MPRKLTPEEDILEDILAEIKLTNRLMRALLAISSATSGLTGVSTGERILLLDKAGLSPSSIARVLGTSPNSISVRLTELRKGARRGKAKV